MSLWWDLVTRPTFTPVPIDQKWDVVIVGAGFSGLWTAHHLLNADSNLKIAILDKGRVGSGASGRNGGWVSALYPLSDDALSKRCSPEQIENLHRELQLSIDEIGNFVGQEKIPCGFHKGGALVVARNGGQMSRLREDLAEGENILGQKETTNRIAMSRAQGSTFTPECAVVNPAALIVGLAESLARRGVAIFENHLATIADQRTVFVDGKALDASFIVRATEAYLERTRNQIPIYSLIVATDPLPDSIISEIGTFDREAFADASHLVTYAQRSEDNRLVIGGRGAPYSWGSHRNDAYESREVDHSRLRAMAKDWFPALSSTKFTHAWGGAVGVTRDWSPYVRVAHGYGELGGYVGDGVTLSYLAAHSMAQLIAHKNSVRSTLPYVQWRSRRWESEPWRWLAVNTSIQLTKLSDKEEHVTNRPSLIMRTLNPALGR